MRDADVLQRLLAAQSEETSQELDSRTASRTACCIMWMRETHPPMYKLSSPDTLSRRDMVSLEFKDR